MPIFDYKCGDCEFRDEYLVSLGTVDAKEPKECPKCGGGMEKVSPLVCKDCEVGLSLIGPGFFVNDYGKHAWKKNMNISDQAQVLTGDKAPY